MITAERLDVTQIIPKLKHSTIFEYFDALDAGEGFIIDNDHDPKPLYYELLGERGNIFTWEYLEQGPEWWRVRIAKKEKKSGNTETIGEIAAKDLRKAQLLKAKGVDFSCGGDKTVKEAAVDLGMEEDQLQEELDNNKSSFDFPPSHDYQKWDIGFLLDYIVHSHHRYVKENSPNLTDLILKVAERHGDQHPELKKLAYAARLFFNDLKAHMQKEETVLFPAIKAMDEKTSSNNQNTKPEDIKSAILMLEKEHQISMEDFAYFRNMTHNYELPDDACDSWAYLYKLLQEFENDWIYHVHLENNILFPKTLEMAGESS